MKAILMGIRSIKTEELGKLTFAVLAAATRKFIVQSEFLDGCDHCHRGFIIMRDSQGRDFSLSCTCDAGSAKHDLAKWNEKKIQELRGRMLTLR